MAPSRQASSRDLRHRVLTCLTKLSDRDTQSLAAAEINSIIPTLTADNFSLFINSLSSTSTADKSTVRVASLRLLANLAVEHGNALSPHLSKLLSAVIRRFRDSDSAVRSACVSAVGSFVSHITKPPFSSIIRPLAESLSTEQDLSAQSTAALCLSAAVQASPAPDVPQMARLLSKWVKLLKSDSFKAKSSLLTLIRSVVGVVEIGNSNLLRDLVNIFTEFLKSDDWMARKAAAEALMQLAMAERGSLSELKASCLKVFESRKFDKVKATREAMNQMLEAWKEIPDVFDDGSPPPQSQISSKENASDGRYPLRSKIPSVVDSNSPQSRRKLVPLRRSSPSDDALKTTARNIGGHDKTKKSGLPIFRKLDCKKPAIRGSDVTDSHTSSVALNCESYWTGGSEKVLQRRDKDHNKVLRPDLKRGLFGKNPGSRVVPYSEDVYESTVVPGNTTSEVCRHSKECEELSSIRKQLGQIEDQQSSLMDLLQKFIGSSQEGMRSLETRVQGLELALDDISYDLAVSTAKMSNYEPPRTSCCLLPSAKFWKRTESCFTAPRFPFPGSSPATAMGNIGGKGPAGARVNLDKKSRLQSPSGFIVNPLAIRSEARRVSESSSSTHLRSLRRAA